MNWITELGLNKEKEELKNQKRYRHGKYSILRISGKRLWMDVLAHWVQDRQECPTTPFFLIICRQGTKRRVRSANMLFTGCIILNQLKHLLCIPSTRTHGEQELLRLLGADAWAVWCSGRCSLLLPVSAEQKFKRYNHLVARRYGHEWGLVSTCWIYGPIPLLSPPGACVSVATAAFEEEEEAARADISSQPTREGTASGIER